jgi:hypothetical protein
VSFVFLKLCLANVLMCYVAQIKAISNSHCFALYFSINFLFFTCSINITVINFLVQVFISYLDNILIANKSAPYEYLG